MPVATTKHANQKLSLCPLLASKFFCYISPPPPIILLNHLWGTPLCGQAITVHGIRIAIPNFIAGFLHG